MQGARNSFKRAAFTWWQVSISEVLLLILCCVTQTVYSTQTIVNQIFTLFFLTNNATVLKLTKQTLFICCASLALASCSTQKNTFVSRQYHNLTAYFNYYYNANDIYKQALKKSEKSFQFNYTLPVPMLLLGEEQTIGSVAGDMDRTIEKCTKLIAKHSITVKPQVKRGLVKGKDQKFYNQNEFVRWSREAWLLIAKAQAWKGDLDKSELAFEYISTRFPNDQMWYEAQVWKARLAIMRNNFVEAADKLNSIENNRHRPRTAYFKHLMASTRATFHLQQNETQTAIPFIKTAINYAPHRRDKLRYTYLLAQIQQQMGQKAAAAENYAKALRLNPSYEMAFSIKINKLALGGTKGEALKKALTKLAKDDKNRDYLDQLYYTLGNLEFEAGNETQAIEYYKLSAQKSTQNDNQKGMSYLVLANYYFDKTQYTQAQGYYDSSIAVLDKNYPNYDEIANKTHFLNNLVKYLNIIDEEDSLLRVAAMPKAQRDAIIAEQIKKIEAEEEAKQLEAQEEQQRAMQYQQRRQYQHSTPGSESGKWYFYNQTSVSYGQTEFQLKWGKRKLADNWRRKNKTDNLMDTELTESTDTTPDPRKDLSNKSVEYYLAGLPMTDEQKQLAHSKIKRATLKAAEIYQTDLNDPQEAKNTYKQYIKRYPEDEESASAYYNLYKIAKSQDDISEMQNYKSLLISNYPKSPYALMLSNPEYFEELKKQVDAQEMHYQTTYQHYSQGNYQQALDLARQGLERYANTKLEAKYLLISALCLGKLGQTDQMKQQLAQVSTKYPKSEEQQLAKRTMQALEARELELTSAQPKQNLSDPDQQTTGTPYAPPQGEHLLALLVPKKTDINQLKFNIISFNVDFYIDQNLNVNNQTFNDFVEIITVSTLKDATMAQEYQRRLLKEQNIFGTLQQSEYQVFIISSENLAHFLQEKSIPAYLKFYRQHYQ